MMKPGLERLGVLCLCSGYPSRNLHVFETFDSPSAGTRHDQTLWRGDGLTNSRKIRVE